MNIKQKIMAAAGSTLTGLALIAATAVNPAESNLNSSFYPVGTFMETPTARRVTEVDIDNDGQIDYRLIFGEKGQLIAEQYFDRNGLLETDCAELNGQYDCKERK